MTSSDEPGAARTGSGRGWVVAALAALCAAAPAGVSAGPAAESEWAVEFCAPVEALPPSRAAGEWTAGGALVRVGAGTVVDAAQAAPAVGVAVTVAGERGPDGAVRADRVTLRAAGCGTLPGPYWAPSFLDGPESRRGLTADPGPAGDAASRDDDAPVEPAPVVVAVGALAGPDPGAAGVAVASLSGEAPALALTVAGLRPRGRYSLALAGAAATVLEASEDGTIRAELWRQLGDGDRLPAGAFAADGPVRLELLDGAGAVAVAGELWAVTTPRDGSAREEVKGER